MDHDRPPTSIVFSYPLLFFRTSDENDEVEVILGPTVSRPVCLGMGHSSGAHVQVSIIVGHLRISSFGRPSLTRGRVTYLYKCYWALPALSLSAPSPAELEAISYCLI
jgi:hypothetical protein